MTAGSHNVYRHVEANCNTDGSTLVGNSGGGATTYTFTDADLADGEVVFACQVGSHCTSGQILTVQVVEDDPATSGSHMQRVTGWSWGVATVSLGTVMMMVIMA